MLANPGVSRMRTLGKGYTYSLCQCAGTYHYAVFARELIKACGFSLAHPEGTRLLIAEVEDFKVVVINIVANKDIREECQE